MRRDTIPKTWATIPASALATFVRGVSYRKEQASNIGQPGMVAILRANNIADTLVLDDLIFVDDHVVSDDQRIKRGDIVFAMSSGSKKHVGKCAIAVKDLDAAFGAFCGVLRPSRDVNASFLAYQFTGNRFRRTVERAARGTNINNLKQQHLLDYELVLPPVDEQDRIVAKIEELFCELDNANDSLRTALQQLRLYREVILDDALQGAKRSMRPLGDLIGPIQQGWSPKCELNRQPESGEWAIIKTTAVQPMRHLPQECKPLPKDLEPDAQIAIREGDILMTRKGPRQRTGVVCLARKVRPRSMLCDTVYRFRANEDLILPEYLELALNSPRVVADIDRRKSGISDSGISLNHRKIQNVCVPLPRDISEQRKIVARVEAAVSSIDNMEAEGERQMNRAATLKQAILRKAFSGELVEQDARDEPASVLLERITIESGQVPQENGARRTTRRRRTGT